MVTKLIGEARRDEVVARIREACLEGQQAYWVCPLIEESETLQLKTAIETFETIRATFADLNVGLVHGRLKADEKADVMQRFTRNEIQLLVATTVIEVGVDVPNASLMVIEHAERMGLSQMHQLRGRIGRGTAASVCILLYQMPLSDTARARLKVIYENSDGFEIARADLLLRGPGEYLGSKQSGLPMLRFADINADVDLLEAARDAAPWLLQEHPAAARAHLDRWLGFERIFEGLTHSAQAHSARSAKGSIATESLAGIMRQVVPEGLTCFRPMTLKQRLALYERLMRLDKPIGILLLLWPTLWALWFAAQGVPNWKVLWIFVLGTVLMRSAGCVINDYADRDFDPFVERTQNRPLAARQVSTKETLMLAAALALVSFLLILPLNRLTLWLSVPALLIAVTYRTQSAFSPSPSLPWYSLQLRYPDGLRSGHRHRSAVGLAASRCEFLLDRCLRYEYAMVDRDDDLRIGIRTAAITFGRFDVLAVMLCYCLFLVLLVVIGLWQKMGVVYYAGLALSAGLFVYHYRLIRERNRERCFKAFLHNNWVGAAIFAGIAADSFCVAGRSLTATRRGSPVKFDHLT